MMKVAELFGGSEDEMSPGVSNGLAATEFPEADKVGELGNKNNEVGDESM